MPAPSRGLVLVPRLPVCLAAFPTQAWTFQAQHTLTVHPTFPILFNPLGQASAHMQDPCSIATPATVDTPVARTVSGVGCNGTFMCCMLGSLSQPQLPTATAHAASTFAAVSHPLKQIASGSLHADFWPDLRSWSWVQTLLFGSFMFSLGITIPGMHFLSGDALHLWEAVACPMKGSDSHLDCKLDRSVETAVLMHWPPCTDQIQSNDTCLEE